jgi:hypothetical protein
MLIVQMLYIFQDIVLEMIKIDPMLKKYLTFKNKQTKQM